MLQDLTQSSNVSVHSDDALVGKVKAAITAADEKRKEYEGEPLRRKPAIVPILPTELPRQFEVTLWDVLHTLARASATAARTECHARRCTHGRESSRRRVGARCAAPDGGPAWLLTVTVAPGAGAIPSVCRLLSAQGQGMLM
ncbi:hypothetical protein ACFYWD_19735 [Streptomyces sp. NPDC003781]|uniref:hypothetical protein n=1 Tax=Streptomyces sp. NPDC003781 TaxID=3364686 RepID=UPI0036A68295